MSTSRAPPFASLGVWFSGPCLQNQSPLGTEWEVAMVGGTLSTCPTVNNEEFQLPSSELFQILLMYFSLRTGERS